MTRNGETSVKLAFACGIIAALLSPAAFAADDGEQPPISTMTATAVSPAIPTDANAPPEAPMPVVIVKPALKPKTHRFFDATNTLGLGVIAASLTADALSTQKGLSYPGFYEMNPLARPFVKTRGGAAAYSAGSFALLTGGMYLAHRTGHHKLERILPFAVAGWEGILSYRNYHVLATHGH